MNLVNISKVELTQVNVLYFYHEYWSSLTYVLFYLCKTLHANYAINLFIKNYSSLRIQFISYNYLLDSNPSTVLLFDNTAFWCSLLYPGPRVEGMIKTRGTPSAYLRTILYNQYDSVLDDFLSSILFNINEIHYRIDECIS